MSAFNTNCSYPVTPVNWVQSPNTRGSFDILSTCLSTILLCTWSVQHLNIPPQHDSPSKRTKFMDAVQQAKMMLVTLVAPEFLLLKSIGDLDCALRLTKQLKGRLQKEGVGAVEWSTVHSFFVNMGGFVVRFNEDGLSEAEDGVTVVNEQNTSVSEVEDRTTTVDTQEANISEVEGGATVHHTQEMSTSEVEDAVTAVDAQNAAIPERRVPASPALPKPVQEKPDQRLVRNLHIRIKHLPPPTAHNSQVVHSLLRTYQTDVLKGKPTGIGWISYVDLLYNIIRLRGSLWALNGSQIIYAQSIGLITLPSIPVSQIEDRSKSDWLIKVLALGHSGWQIIQLVVRFCLGLPSSQAEVATVAFAVVAFCIYLVYWDKPQGVKTPVFIEAKRWPSRAEIEEMAKRGPAYLASLFPGYEYTIPEHALHDSLEERGNSLEGGVWAWVGGCAGGVAFGLLHCAAWKFHFPTEVESLLWKIASVTICIVPIGYALRIIWLTVMDGVQASRDKRDWVRRIVVFMDRLVWLIFGAVVVVLYVLSRIYLLVETCRSSFYLVPKTFLDLPISI